MKLSTLTHNGRPCLGLRKAAAAVIIGLAIFSVTESVDAAAIESFVIEDVGSTVGGIYNPSPDGNSGGFQFNIPIDPATYAGVTGFNTDTGTPMTWQGNIQGPNVFSTGFNFGGSVDVDLFTYGTINSTAPGSPFTGMGANGDITGGSMTISSLDWAAGPLFSTVLDPFPMSPDTGTLQVNWVEPGANPNEFLVSLQWSHLILQAEDPSGQFFGQNTMWILEGTATVVPLPATAWLFGSGLLGLVGIARRRKAA